jgi:hypothetical protein
MQKSAFIPVDNLCGSIYNDTHSYSSNISGFKKWASLGPDVTVIADVKPPEVVYERVKERLDGLQDFCLD